MVSTTPSCLQTLLGQNKTTLRTISLENPHPSPNWTFPATSLSIRNLTTIFFTGHFPAVTNAFSEILNNGKQLESLSLTCCALECSNASTQFRSAQHLNSLPFLRHFSFSVEVIGRRTVDRDLFPAIAEFLRGRRQLRSLQLIAREETIQHAVGFDAAIWGVLPSLEGLKGLKISYPSDLAPGLASWLIPRSVLALRLTIDYNHGSARDPIPFLNVSFSPFVHVHSFPLLTSLIYIPSLSNCAMAYHLLCGSWVCQTYIFEAHLQLWNMGSRWFVSSSSAIPIGPSRVSKTDPGRLLAVRPM